MKKDESGRKRTAIIHVFVRVFSLRLAEKGKK